MRKPPPWLMNLAFLVVTLTSLGVVGWFAYQAVQGDDSAIKSAKSGPLISAVVVQLAGLLILPVIWQGLLGIVSLKSESDKVDFSREAIFKIYGRSWLARYIPGRIWAVVGRLALASRYGIPVDACARSTILEVVFLYGTLLVLGVALVAFALVGVIVGGLVGLVCAAIFVASLLVGWKFLAKWVKRDGGSILTRVRTLIYQGIVGDKPLSLKDVVWATATYGLVSCLQLAFIIFIAMGFADVSAADAGLVAGAWAISTATGYVVIFAPSGIGVKDGVALAILAQVFDGPTAGLIVATSRILTLVADIAFVGLVESLLVGFWVNRRMSRFRSPALSGGTTSLEQRIPPHELEN